MKFDYFDISQQAAKAYARQMEPVLRRYSLTKKELDVLLFLYNNPEFDRAADIVAHRGMAKSHVSLSVSSLENRNLLTGCADPEDRRAVRLRLTGEGSRIAREGRELQESFFRAIFAGLSRKELDRFLKIKETIGRNIQAMKE